MKLKLLILPFVLLVAALAIAGCSGDDDNAGDDGGSDPTATADNSGDDDAGATDAPTDAPSGDDSGDDGGGGFGSGTGTLTIGETTYEITGIGCVFSAEEARNPDFPFNLSGFGEVDGHRAQLSADIYDPSGEEKTEGEGVSHNISYDDIEDFENPVVSWSTIGAFGGTETKLTIDGKHISGVGSFDDGTTDEFESIDGTLEVDCP